MAEEIFRVSRNEMRAKSLFEMAEDRYKDIKKESKTYKIVEEYYEIIKELITSLMNLDGFKTLSHKMLVIYLKGNYKKFNNSEIILIDELRKIRNDIVYYGKDIQKEFLINNQEDISHIINKLFKIVKNKLSISKNL